MDSPNDLPGSRTTTTEQREQSARRALHAYRERRRHRRADDTFFGSAEPLALNADTGGAARERRHSEILADAEEAGMPQDLAEKLYIVAREEGLDPGLGFELVRTGLGVCPPAEGLSNAAAAPTADKYLPEWIFPPTPTDEMLRERTLRLSFRRLRDLLKAHPEPEDAFDAFAHEPDVEHCGY